MLLAVSTETTGLIVICTASIVMDETLGIIGITGMVGWMIGRKRLNG